MGYVNCANCGKQVLVDKLDDKCYWCGKSVSRKEVIMGEEEIVKEAVEAVLE